MSDISKENVRSLPLVSIITVVYNNAQYIKKTIQSVLSQDYSRVEYVVIDGGSNDGTVEIIKEFRDNITVFISEEDKGIYDALNKGIQNVSGEIIGILHSGDLFCNEKVISASIQQICATGSEFCFSDLLIVDSSGNKVLRFYMAHYFRRWMLRTGWIPPHPTCFIAKSLFDDFGLYSTDYEVAGDFDFLVRIFYGRKINWVYLNSITVKMRYGGASNSGWKSKWRNMTEISKVLHDNQIWSLTIFQLFRYFIRCLELFLRPMNNRCK